VVAGEQSSSGAGTHRNAAPVPFWENGSSKLGPARSAVVEPCSSHETDVVDADTVALCTKVIPLKISAQKPHLLPCF